ncbi:hypothetical protein ADZ37_17885 [Pannonibacter phragmitetus]|nr:hypothetical protein ADZ37_17885 [Pannonibacter phragmitetus]
MLGEGGRIEPVIAGGRLQGEQMLEIELQRMEQREVVSLRSHDNAVDDTFVIKDWSSTIAFAHFASEPVQGSWRMGIEILWHSRSSWCQVLRIRQAIAVESETSAAARPLECQFERRDASNWCRIDELQNCKVLMQGVKLTLRCFCHDFGKDTERQRVSGQHRIAPGKRGTAVG